MEKKKEPFELFLVVTHNCNLDCIYCYEHNKNVSRMDVNLAKQIVEEYLTNGSYEEIRIGFFGGEPFLEFDLIKEVCEWVWSKNWGKKYQFFATTNGTLVQNEIKEWLKKHKHRFGVILSIDGESESHNINRNNSFDLIDFAFFKEYWSTPIAKMTISKETVHNLYNNIVYIHSLGYKISGANFAAGIDWGDIKFKTIVFEQLEKLCQYYIENPNIKPVSLINKQIFKCEVEKNRKEWCGCGLGVKKSAYDTDGKKFLCAFFTPMVFNEEQLFSINKIDCTNADFFIDNECFNNCYLEPICDICHGANLLQNGKINMRDRSKCELMKICAVFSAALAAHRLKQNPEDNYENLLTTKAIQKINALYQK